MNKMNFDIDFFHVYAGVTTIATAQNSAPEPADGEDYTHSAPPNSLAVFKGPTFKGKERAYEGG